MINRTLKIIVACYLVISLPLMVPLKAFAEEKETPSIELLEQQRNIKEVFDSLNEMESLMEKILYAKRIDCLMAFGHDRFCDCLVEQSPIGLDFAGYIIAVITTKEDLGYDKLQQESKELIDKALEVREKCVALIHGKENKGNRGMQD